MLAVHTASNEITEKTMNIIGNIKTLILPLI
jgi:hypothetical protein